MVNPITGVNVRCFRNAEEIARYIGESPRNIAKLVIDEGLPAWKRNGKGSWRATDFDLDYWLCSQREKYLPEKIKDAQEEIKKRNKKHHKLKLV